MESVRFFLTAKRVNPRTNDDKPIKFEKGIVLESPATKDSAGKRVVEILDDRTIRNLSKEHAMQFASACEELTLREKELQDECIGQLDSVEFPMVFIEANPVKKQEPKKKKSKKKAEEPDKEEE